VRPDPRILTALEATRLELRRSSLTPEEERRLRDHREAKADAALWETVVGRLCPEDRARLADLSLMPDRINQETHPLAGMVTRWNAEGLGPWRRTPLGEKALQMIQEREDG
jgi:hypothetical protein